MQPDRLLALRAIAAAGRRDGAFIKARYLCAQHLQAIAKPPKTLARKIALIADTTSDYCDLYVALCYLVRALRPARYLEIGVNRGASFLLVLACSDKGPAAFTEAVAVDLWQELYADEVNVRAIFESNLRSMFPRAAVQMVEVMQDNSFNALFEMAYVGRRFDLITVDGDHSQEGAWQDLLSSLRLLAADGVIVMDDIAHPAHGYLRNTARDFALFAELELIEIDTAQSNGVAVFYR